jgi:hypothetical protein
MANPNPTRARQARARKRLDQIKVVDLKEARQALSYAMTELLGRLQDETTVDELCKLVNALTRTSAELRANLEGVEFEERLKVLENQQRPSNKTFRGITA